MGLRLSDYPILNLPQPDFNNAVIQDLRDNYISGIISLGEALDGLKKKRYGWAAIKLYYTAFFGLRATILSKKVVPFHSGKQQFFCDSVSGLALKMGTSDHDLDFNRLRNFSRLRGWQFSEASAETMHKLRAVREKINYRFAFPDPGSINEFTRILEFGLEKSFRQYKSDLDNTYTFLEDHFILAYPTRLLEDVSRDALGEFTISKESKDHLKRVWPIKNFGLVDRPRSAISETGSFSL